MYDKISPIAPIVKSPCLLSKRKCGGVKDAHFGQTVQSCIRSVDRMHPTYPRITGSIRSTRGSSGKINGRDKPFAAFNVFLSTIVLSVIVSSSVRCQIYL